MECRYDKQIKTKNEKMNFLSQPRVRVRKQTIEKKMKTFYQLLEGVYDPNIFKAFFMAGEPNSSGKSYDRAIRYRTITKRG